MLRYFQLLSFKINMLIIIMFYFFQKQKLYVILPTNFSLFISTYVMLEWIEK